ncbi:MAG: hypothetical protein ICV59_00720 [Thermoleophilia bacterium]|nr:hypothetical protein [Thermoleophilia bacterium]
MTRHTFSLSRTTFVLLLAAAALVAAGVAFGLVRSSSEPDTAQTETADSLRFDSPPLPLGQKVADVNAASRLLPFDPVVPDSLGEPKEVWVQENTQTALLYDSGAFGRFNVYEAQRDSNIDLKVAVQGLKKLAADCAERGSCEGAVEKMISLADGTPALLIQGNPELPHHTTSVLWFDEEISWNVVGPVASFATAEAVAVANAFATADK